MENSKNNSNSTRILLSLGNYRENLDASTKIALNVFSEVKKRNVYCIAIGVSTKRKHLTYNGMEVEIVKYDFCENMKEKMHELYLSSVEKYNHQKKVKNTINKIIFGIIHPLTTIQMILFSKVQVEYQKKSTKKYVREVQKISKKYHISDIVCLQEPSWATNAVFESNIANNGIKLSIYQVDPYGLQSINFGEDYEIRINREHNNFNKSKIVFTTPQLYREYLQNIRYSKFIGKIIKVELPCVYNRVSSSKPSIDFDKRYINILFTGMLIGEYRSIDYFLKVFEAICSVNKMIRVYFQGDIFNKKLTEYIERYPNNVFIVDRSSSDVAFANMKEANVLLNIGNNVENMVPSKIFEYFSAGKPILNIRKIKNCPSSIYFSKYPAYYTINEYEDFKIDEILSFLETNKDVNIDFKYVENKFNKNTLSYVSKLVWENFTKNEQ